MASQFARVRFSFFAFTLMVWTTSGFGQAPKLLKESAEPASFVAVSPDGKTIAYTNADNIIRLWDVKTGMVTRKIKVTSLPLPPQFNKRVTCIIFSPDGKTLAASSIGVSARPSEKAGELGQIGMESLIEIWDTKTGTLIRTPFRSFDKSNDLEDWVKSLAFSPDGKFLASCGYSKFVKVRVVKSGKEIQTLNGDSEGFGSVVFSPDGKTLAASGGPEKSVLWDLNTGKQLWSHKNNGDGPCLIAFSPNGDIFSMADSEGIHIYDAKTRNESQLIKNVEDHMFFCVAFGPKGRTMVSCEITGADADDYGLIKLWKINRGQIAKTREFRVQYYLLSATFFLDGQTLLSNSSLYSEPTKFRLWDLRSIKLAKKPK